MTNHERTLRERELALHQKDKVLAERRVRRRRREMLKTPRCLRKGELHPKKQPKWILYYPWIGVIGKSSGGAITRYNRQTKIPERREWAPK